MTKRRSDQARIVALIATFLLLMAGFVVSAPGLVSVSATGPSTTVDDAQGGDDDGDECQNDDDEGEGDEAVNSAEYESDDSADDEACGALLTLVKYPENDHGGVLAAEDFQLLLDGLPVEQGIDLAVTAGVQHEISEVSQPGYELRAVSCSNDVEYDQQYGDLLVTLMPGEHVYCAVINDDIAPTITVHKTVVNDNGGTAEALDFMLTINGEQAEQDVIAYEVMANEPSIVSEVLFQGYTATSVVCTSDIEGSLNNKSEEGTRTITVTPVLDENIDCTITNDDDNLAEPMDLALTKSDDGFVKVAGGDSFDYTIAVQNVGGSNVSTDAPVTVTDQLPDGLVFVTIPSNCLQAGQTLTCSIDPADLDVDDAPVEITVTVQALADTASDAYTNIAYVDTAQDPACEGEGCVPICDGYSNNVDCESTTITGEASLTIDKVDNVDVVSPGDVYSYMITVTNPGPSTLVSDVTMTDDLPAGLQLVSVSAGGAWTCSDADPVECTFGESLAAGASAPTITITVKLDSDYLDNSVYNIASTSAMVDPYAVATDDETTPVAREADLSIDKSVSQSTAVSGGQFNWFLAVTNHGPDTATNLAIDDTLPAQFEVMGVFPPSGVTCTNTKSTVHCTAASLLIDQTVKIQVQVMVVSGAAVGVVSNTGTVTADSTDPVPGNNSDSASITITSIASEAPVAVAQRPSAAVSPQLPRTGNTSLGEPLGLAGLLCGAGVLTLIIARRRHSAVA